MITHLSTKKWQKPSKQNDDCGDNTNRNKSVMMQQSQVANQIDELSNQIMQARCKGQDNQTNKLIKQLKELEQQFSSMSTKLNRIN